METTVTLSPAEAVQIEKAISLAIETVGGDPDRPGNVVARAARLKVSAALDSLIESEGLDAVLAAGEEQFHAAR